MILTTKREVKNNILRNFLVRRKNSSLWVVHYTTICKANGEEPSISRLCDSLQDRYHYWTPNSNIYRFAWELLCRAGRENAMREWLRCAIHFHLQGSTGLPVQSTQWLPLFTPASKMEWYFSKTWRREMLKSKSKTSTDSHLIICISRVVQSTSKDSTISTQWRHATYYKFPWGPLSFSILWVISPSLACLLRKVNKRSMLWSIARKRMRRRRRNR